MASLFTSCFGWRKDTSPRLASQEEPLHNRDTPPAGYRPIDDVNPAKCIFCNVTPDRFNIILEDEQFICFSDRSPAALVHLLVIPRRHIANVQSLTHRDTELVRQMQSLGDRALDAVAHDTPSTKVSAYQERRFGFHIPPFRSVDHLHLHCLQLPFKSSLKALKYGVAQPPSAEYYKGWSWFAEWAQTCALLDAGRKVKVNRC